jgi:hypothetical protein
LKIGFSELDPRQRPLLTTCKGRLCEDLRSASRIYAALRNVQKHLKTDKNCMESFDWFDKITTRKLRTRYSKTVRKHSKILDDDCAEKLATKRYKFFDADFAQ